MMVRDDSKFLERKEEVKYDSGCPYYKFLFDDLSCNSPFYDHYCGLRFFVDSAGSHYEFCDQEDHRTCQVYLNEIAKRQKEQASLEGAD